MKKVFLILVFVIALIGFGVNAMSENPSLETNIENAQKDCYCPNCDVKLQTEQRTEEQWFDCYACGGDGLVTGTCKNCEQCRECDATGKQKCQGWQNCSSCGGNGCKNGYTTNGGKECAYGYCNSCGGKGGRYVMDRWTSCNNCSLCGGDGLRDVLKSDYAKCTSSSCRYNSKSGRYGEWKIGRYYNVLVCPKCKREYSGC